MEMTSMSPDIVKMVSAIIEVIEDNHGYTVDEIDYDERRRKPTIFSRGMNPCTPRKPYIPYKHITF